MAQIELSSLCPNNCQHCYNFWRDKSGEKKYSMSGSLNVSMDQIEIIMNQLIRHRIFHIVLTGGEPLINKKAMFRAIEMATSNGITTSINSTLFNLNRDDSVRLKKLGVSVVMTSILGPNSEIHDCLVEKQGALKKTTEGIKLLQEFHVPVTVNMVVTKKNIAHISQTMRLVKELGLKGFNCTRAGCPGNCHDFDEYSLTLTEFRQYLKELRTSGLDEGMSVDALTSYPLCGIKNVNDYERISDRRCMAGVNSIAISSDGGVRPCTHVDKNYGNIFTDDLSDIWNRMTEWRDGSLLPNTCKTCKALLWCGGGCRMEAKMRVGSIRDLDPYSSPNDSETVYKLLKQRKEEHVEIPERVTINPRIRWRPESFGVAVFAGTRFACYLNQDGANLFFELTQKEILDREVFIEKCNTIGNGFADGLVRRKVMVSSTTQ